MSADIRHSGPLVGPIVSQLRREWTQSLRTVLCRATTASVIGPDPIARPTLLGLAAPLTVGVEFRTEAEVSLVITVVFVSLIAPVSAPGKSVAPKKLTSTVQPR